MPHLIELTRRGEQATLVPSFPAVTWPVQANMLTGRPPSVHGVVANGFFWRDRGEVEMWTAWNKVIMAPQIWDTLHNCDPPVTSAVWFPMLSKGCGADYVCMPAPIHNPDGSESLWCYTKPQQLYGELRDRLGHFPLQHFWGPLANIKSTSWIAESAIDAAGRFQPSFFYVYLPHLDYAAQKTGPDSVGALQAVRDLDQVIGRMASEMSAAYQDGNPTWLVASEYVIVDVNHVSYPNRVLRHAGLLRVTEHDDGEHLDLAASEAWALVDHQFSHIFVRDRAPSVIKQVRELFSTESGIDQVLSGSERDNYSLNHERSGDVILISTPESWQAYYWWLDDARAPRFARTVDIHAKPGYDPVELHFDPATKGIPLDATLIRGSHGAPPHGAGQEGVLISSTAGTIGADQLHDVDVAGVVLRMFGVSRF
jgi:predicted AlkP superfamily pyrophosphatase or phosphodiesterase